MVQRFFYISNVFEENVKRFRSISGDSPAASGKVIRLCRAVRAQGGKAAVLSLGRCRQMGSWKWFPAVIGRSEGVPIVYAAYFDAPLVNHFVSCFSLFFIFLRISRRNSILIFYNYLAYYVPTLIVGRLLNRRCILDLEDGCRSDDKTIRGRFNRYLLKIHDMFCNGGAMLASSSLIEQISLRPAIVCYGVAPAVQYSKDWRISPLQVVFGGNLSMDTGVDLFLDALKVIVLKRPDVLYKLKIVVTGFGSFLQKIMTESVVNYNGVVDVRGDISNDEYVELLHQSHIGLCLKIPYMSMGKTTFPSKVVEMAAYGLLVVTTMVSDVPLLFSDRTAFILKDACPQELAAVLCDLVDFPDKSRDIALQGQIELASLLSSERVGAALLEFWKGVGSVPGLI